MRRRRRRPGHSLGSGGGARPQVRVAFAGALTWPPRSPGHLEAFTSPGGRPQSAATTRGAEVNAGQASARVQLAEGAEALDETDGQCCGIPQGGQLGRRRRQNRVEDLAEEGVQLEDRRGDGAAVAAEMNSGRNPCSRGLVCALACLGFWVSQFGGPRSSNRGDAAEIVCAL